MTRAGGFTVAPDHPALPGHFPGRPILPGVVLLDHVLRAVEKAHPGRVAEALPTVKFLRPVRPGDAVDILTDGDGDRTRFVCRVDADDVARGTIRLQPA